MKNLSGGIGNSQAQAVIIPCAAAQKYNKAHKSNIYNNFKNKVKNMLPQIFLYFELLFFFFRKSDFSHTKFLLRPARKARPVEFDEGARPLFQGAENQAGRNPQPCR